jgi:hypothetical protein
LDAETTPATKPKRRISYLRSGMYAKRPELPAADTPVGAVLSERRQALIGDLGGQEACSTAQLALVDLAIRQWLLLDSVDGYLLTLPSLVDKRHRHVWQVVLDRSALAASLERTLARLGLERRAKPVPSLEEYMRAKDEEAEDAAENGGPTDGGRFAGERGAKDQPFD